MIEETSDNVCQTTQFNVPEDTPSSQFQESESVGLIIMTETRLSVGRKRFYRSGKKSCNRHSWN
jgi:hypothetical protein